MRTILCSLLLLCCAYVATAQTLTLDQLVHLRGLEQLEQDAYLSQRGWKYYRLIEDGDSIFTIFWRYRAKGVDIAEVGVKNQIGSKAEIFYGTDLRAPFDAIRSKITVYQMELLGTNNRDNALRTYYRGQRYDAVLVISGEPDAFQYQLGLRLHGLIKGYVEDDRGNWIPQWFDQPEYTEEQKRRFDAFADSVEKSTQSLRVKRQAKPPHD